MLSSQDLAAWAADHGKSREEAGAASWDSGWIDDRDIRGSQRLLGSAPLFVLLRLSFWWGQLLVGAAFGGGRGFLAIAAMPSSLPD